MTVQAIFSHLNADRANATLDRTTAAFGLSAAVAIVFNAALTIVKDSYDPLNGFMAKLTGHHWITHGLVVIAVFLVVGWALSRSEATGRLSDTSVIGSVVLASVLSGAAIALWFLFV